ncbi:SDR family NAD(P)-dependent oxidoreductase [Alicyclobacillus sacchari]|uniref:SDR family NAD(P)-dependent oxidoreductase n=1 Tax=Alicyclobacillus sacchari TaxID=392010 RepID=UPI0024E186F9|nr:SDR family NAD(P)-dependent oxidoreductase [Alicyclobacillus sacchari]
MDWTIDRMPSMQGTTAIVTGANSGIGWEAAKALAARHARVILAVRNLDRGEMAKNRILSEIPHANVAVKRLDLADLRSVQAFAEDVTAQEVKVNLLINNAGVMAPSYQTTRQGLELQFGTNHIGHFALTLRLLPTLCSGRGARVVTVSSMAHTMAKALDISYLRGHGRYRRFTSYAQSKLANLLFTYELQRRVQRRGLAIQSMAAHPASPRRRCWTMACLHVPDGFVHLHALRIVLLNRVIWAPCQHCTRRRIPTWSVVNTSAPWVVCAAIQALFARARLLMMSMPPNVSGMCPSSSRISTWTIGLHWRMTCSLKQKGILQLGKTVLPIWADECQQINSIVDRCPQLRGTGEASHIVHACFG